MLPTLVVLSAMGLLVLMIACANIAGLVLVRGVSRRGEIARASGARRDADADRPPADCRKPRPRRARRRPRRPARAARHPGARRLRRVARGACSASSSTSSVDGLVIGFAVLVACGSALVFGFVPALQSSRVDLVSVINEDASPRGAARGRLRAGLVVAQVAVSLLLLVGAGLATRSLEAARRANPGFDAEPRDGDRDGRQTERVRRAARPRVLSPAAGRGARRSGHRIGHARRVHVRWRFSTRRAQRVAIDGYEPRRDEDLAFMSNTVGPDYFRTLRIALMAGRAFEDRDDETAAPVAIVNNTLAQRFWGGAANAIGKRVRVGDGDWRTVIGVAADVKYLRINESPRPYVYLPFLQAYRSSMILHTAGRGAGRRARGSGARARRGARRRSADSVTRGRWPSRSRGALILFDLTATMLFLFGVAGMALAAMGTYGLVSYTVKQSTHEIGIRMALGASGLSVVRGFLGRGLRLGAVGAALGIVAALGVSRLLGSVLFGVSATDAVSFARALAIVLGGVVVATIVPAWRAARTNPLSALRHQ